MAVMECANEQWSVGMGCVREFTYLLGILLCESVNRPPVLVNLIYIRRCSISATIR